MKGLIIKDLFSVRRELKMIAIFTVVASVVALYLGMEFGLGFVIFMAGSMSISSFAYDDMSNWNRTALSMPVKRSEIVISKYITNVLLILSSTIIGTIIFSIYSLVGLWDNSILEVCSVALMSFVVATAFFSIVIPFIYKFGTERTRLILIVAIIVPLTISFALKELMTKLSPIDTTFLEQVFPFAVPAIAIIMFFGSIGISIGIFKRKEM